MDINTFSIEIDLGAMALPEFQRGYVWNRSQMRLMASPYRRYPVGGLLVWVTKTEERMPAVTISCQPAMSNSFSTVSSESHRSTDIIRGTPPPFFEGSASTFTDLYFNLEDETFEFYGPVKMGGDPRWISVTELMKNNLGPFIGRIYQTEQLQPHAEEFISRLNRLHSIKGDPRPHRESDRTG
ncbi:MAG: DUF262 domain-containing protein [Caldilineales bacterium]